MTELSKEGNKLYEKLINLCYKRKKPIEFDEVMEMGKKAGVDPNELNTIFNSIFEEQNAIYGSMVDNFNNREEPKKIIKDKIKDKIDEFVIYNNVYDRLLSKNEFEKLIRGWKKGRDELPEGIKTWYDYYFKVVHEKPGMIAEYNKGPKIKFPAYRSPIKNKRLKELIFFKNDEEKIDYQLKHNPMPEIMLEGEYEDNKRRAEYLKPSTFPLKKNHKYTHTCKTPVLQRFALRPFVL